MEFHTARSDGHERLYHWQCYDRERLRTFLRDRTIYCSNPANFNDPWDCKPHFNTELLEQPVEHQRHVQWAVDICRQYNPMMSAEDINHMEAKLLSDPQFLAATLNQTSKDMRTAFSAQYRVYCLGPDVGNLLMWSHYADSHKGICLEFSTRNEVMCCPLRIKYFNEFPIMRLYSTDEAETLLPLLTKANVWEYEDEYRIIAQEQSNATGPDTLITESNLLKLPDGALLSIIVGCQGPYDEVLSLVSEVAPDVTVKMAKRVPNRFELEID